MSCVSLTWQLLTSDLPLCSSGYIKVVSAGQLFVHCTVTKIPEFGKSFFHANVNNNFLNFFRCQSNQGSSYKTRLVGGTNNGDINENEIVDVRCLLNVNIFFLSITLFSIIFIVDSTKISSYKIRYLNNNKNVEINKNQRCRWEMSVKYRKIYLPIIVIFTFIVVIYFWCRPLSEWSYDFGKAV